MSTTSKTNEARETGPILCPKEHTHRHGESSTCYWYGCRCAPCREYCTERQFYMRNMRRAGKYAPAKPVPAIGTQRRLHALETLGWSAANVAARMGVSGVRVRQINQAEMVSVENAEKVKAVYDELWATPAPRTAATIRTRRRAERMGFAPPLAWDDDSIDDPAAKPETGETYRRGFMSRHDPVAVADALDGIPTDLSPLERREVVTVLNARRWAAHRIAQYAGCDVKTVERIREELNLPVPTHNQIREAA